MIDLVYKIKHFFRTCIPFRKSYISHIIRCYVSLSGSCFDIPSMRPTHQAVVVTGQTSVERAIAWSILQQRNLVFGNGCSLHKLYVITLTASLAKTKALCYRCVILLRSVMLVFLGYIPSRINKTYS